MKNRSIAGVVLSLVFATAAYGQIVNGSFEEGTDPGFFQNYSAPNNTAITGWTIDSGNLDYIGLYWQASDGTRSLDMSGFGSAASLSQTFDTTPGVTYTVTFDLSGNPGGEPVTKTLAVSATGADPQTYTYTLGALNSLFNMLWASHSYTFTAAGTSTTLTFSTPDVGSFGPALDNVAISAVVDPPTTATVCHRNHGKATFKTLIVDLESLEDHLGHGDQLGPCPADE